MGCGIPGILELRVAVETSDYLYKYMHSMIIYRAAQSTQRECSGQQSPSQPGASFFFFQASICTGPCEQLPPMLRACVLYALVRRYCCELSCAVLLGQRQKPYAQGQGRRRSRGAQRSSAQYSAQSGAEVRGRGLTGDTGALGGS